MKIAFINNFFNAGGSAKTALSLANNFSKNNQMQFYGFWDGIYREKFEKLGKVSILKSLNFDYSDELLEELYKFSPDVVHVFVPGSQNPSYFKKFPTACKKFVTVLCEQKIGFDYLDFDKIFFISNYGEAFSGKKPNSIVIRPGYEYDFLEKVQSAKPSIARVSAFCPSKLIDHTVVACSEHKKLTSTIVGEIQDLQYYKAILNLRDQLGLKNMRIIANGSEELVYQTINDADIWHYPTSSEAFCFSVLEGIAAKKPVISYKSGAITELFDSTEWLADKMDDLLEKTNRLISLSPSERTEIGRKNYMMYMRHNSDIFAERVMAEYKKIIGKDESL